MWEENKITMEIECRSFGFKNGADTNADISFDVRCLPNPFYIKELKNKTGLDKPVRDYILGYEQSRTYLQKVIDFILFLIPIYKENGKEKLTVSFGCTGGHHRSVTFAIMLCDALCEKGYNAVCYHRDINIQD